MDAVGEVMNDPIQIGLEVAEGNTICFDLDSMVRLHVTEVIMGGTLARKCLLYIHYW